MLCPYLLISINELLISIISFNDINKYGLNVKTAAHRNGQGLESVLVRKEVGPHVDFLKTLGIVPSSKVEE